MIHGKGIRALEILKAALEDAEEILMIQKLAYQSEAALYGDYNIPPLRQTVGELRAQFRDHLILKAVFNGKIIGTVRAYEEDSTCYIGRLAVHPEFQNPGAGTALMKAVEDCFCPQRYELFTGSKSEKNIHIYKKLGYNIYKRDSHGCGEIEIFILEKHNKQKR